MQREGVAHWKQVVFCLLLRSYLRNAGVSSRLQETHWGQKPLRNQGTNSLVFYAMVLATFWSCSSGQPLSARWGSIFLLPAHLVLLSYRKSSDLGARWSRKSSIGFSFLHSVFLPHIKELAFWVAGNVRLQSIYLVTRITLWSIGN